MKIIVQQGSLRDMNNILNDICRMHWKKINRVRKAAHKIEFINGDEIRFISTDPRYTDGLRADIAIGPNAHYFTCCSEEKKRIWNLSDLDNYLKNI